MARSIQTATDALDFFVQCQDSLSPTLDITATGTGTNNSVDFKNTLHRGANFFITIASISVTAATLALNILGKNAAADADDPSAYFVINRVSIDGIAATGNYAVQIYPGMVAAGAVAGQTPNTVIQAQGLLPAVFQLQASLTLQSTASVSTGVISYEIGMSKSL